MHLNFFNQIMLSSCCANLLNEQVLQTFQRICTDSCQLNPVTPSTPYTLGCAQINCKQVDSSLTTEAAKMVAVAIVGSRLDYCNSSSCRHIHIKSCSPSDGSEHPGSSCCTKVSVLPHHASFGRPALATRSPSN